MSNRCISYIYGLVSILMLPGTVLFWKWLVSNVVHVFVGFEYFYLNGDTFSIDLCLFYKINKIDKLQ